MTDMTKPKLNKIAGVFRNGAYIPHVARDGRPKKLTVPEITRGMKRQTQGKIHPYLHSRPVDDETCDKLSQNARTVPVHPGMTSKIQRDTDRGPDHASAVLQEAGRLGRPKE
jgi:hypothetical protein